ncbi:hypothetical protein, partial [Allopusillimonas ginsengisoli]|uniref:hypothetical protein n=1 Tax=Allopusillimonas ginsengisoli TaxID=453575 RepID=UPI001AD97108
SAHVQSESDRPAPAAQLATRYGLINNACISRSQGVFAGTLRCTDKQCSPDEGILGHAQQTKASVVLNY